MIELSGVSKSFPGVKALDDVQFNLKAGEVHALLGENGAGKSTLMKIISGIYQRDAGRYIIDGEEIGELTPKTAQALGIGRNTITRKIAELGIDGGKDLAE